METQGARFIDLPSSSMPPRNVVARILGHVNLLVGGTSFSTPVPDKAERARGACARSPDRVRPMPFGRHEPFCLPDGTLQADARSKRNGTSCDCPERRDFFPTKESGRRVPRLGARELMRACVPVAIRFSMFERCIGSQQGRWAEPQRFSFERGQLAQQERYMARQPGRFPRRVVALVRFGSDDQMKTCGNERCEVLRDHLRAAAASVPPAEGGFGEPSEPHR